MLLPNGSKRRSGRSLKSFLGVTVHNVGNQRHGANADANARYQKNSANTTVVGWHYTVDETEIIRSIPEDEVAEHTGKRAGNDTTIGIEICDHSDGDILKATNNAAWLAADILKRHGHTKAIWKENVFQHFDWSGKNCPAQLRAGRPYSFEVLIQKVNECIGMQGIGEEREAEQAQEPQTTIPKLIDEYGKKVVLKKGCAHKELVKVAQMHLKRHLAYHGEIDGLFGPKTHQATIAFQSARLLEGRDVGVVYNGNRPDGMIGEKTWAILWES